MENYMNATTVSALTTALWILIEAIQFGYMAYLMWRNKHDLNRYPVGPRPSFTGA